MRDLQRYMGIVGARVAMPLGEPWRVGKRPYGQGTLSAAASCLKGFYLHLAGLGVNRDLGGQLTGPGCRPGLTATGQCWGTCAASCPSTRWHRAGSGAGTRRCCPMAPGTC